MCIMGNGKIGTFLQNINKELSENFEEYEIICVNDKSTDNTLEEIKRVASNMKKRIINMSYYQGLELSMNAGIDLTIGDFV